MFRPSIAAYRRSVASAMGNYNLAGRTFAQALAESRELSDRWGYANVLWRRAETEAATPDPAH